MFDLNSAGVRKERQREEACDSLLAIVREFTRPDFCKKKKEKKGEENFK